MPDAPKVFCSHRSVDKPRVLEVAKRSPRQVSNPGVDEWEILPGDDFVQAINEGLAACDLGLIFLSKAAAEGKWVEAEINRLTQQAVEQGKRVIPVLLELDAPIPELLRTRVHIQVHETDRLIATIRRQSGKPEVQAEQPEHRVRLTVRRSDAGYLKVACEIDGKPAAAGQPVGISAGFAFSYAGWLSGRQSHLATPADHTAELRKLGVPSAKCSSLRPSPPSLANFSIKPPRGRNASNSSSNAMTRS